MNRAHAAIDAAAAADVDVDVDVESVATAAQIFIYFRVAPADEAVIRRRVVEFQQALCRRFGGLRAHLLRRQVDAPAATTSTAPTEPLLTLMETYAFDANPNVITDAGVSRPVALADLLAAIDQAAEAIGPMIRGERHVEVFEACA